MDISCLRDARQQTSRTSLLLSVDGTDGRTDRQTDKIGSTEHWIFIAGSCELTLSNLFCRLRREGPKIEA